MDDRRRRGCPDGPYWQIIHDAYVALCHDDPVVVSDEACQLLADALQDPNSPLALSDRLVQGIQQATVRTTTTTTTGIAANSATPMGYSILALTIFLQIPILCLQDHDLERVRNCWIGSYRGPPQLLLVDDDPNNDVDENNNNNDDDDDDDLDNNDINNNNNDPLFNHVAENHDHRDSRIRNGHVTHDDPDPLAEVWADESDASDFEYETGVENYQYQEETANLYYWHFDPLSLSQSPPPQPDQQDEMQTLRQAIVNLISELGFHKLLPLSNNTNIWNKWQVSDLLTQLVLTLLVPVVEIHQTRSLLCTSEMSLHRMDWRKWGLHTLWVLRDAALAHPQAYLDDYLTLLQTLLAIDGAATGAAAGTDHKQSRHAQHHHHHDSTMIGFAALSSLCHEIFNRHDTDPEQKTFLLVTTRKSLLGCIDDLAHMLNTILSQQHPMDTTTIMHVVWNLLPLLELLTGIRGSDDGVLLGPPSSLPRLVMTNSEAQGLLNSSLFREILFLYVATATSIPDVANVTTSTSTSSHVAESTISGRLPCCRSLGRCIMFLMAQSTSLLNKYAWRVPQFTGAVLNDSLLQSDAQQSGQPDSQQHYEDLVDHFFWNLLGSVDLVTRSSVDPPRVVWKTKNQEETNSTIQCPEKSRSYFVKICGACTKAMYSLKEVRLFQQLKQDQQRLSSAPIVIPENHPVRTFISQYGNILQDMSFLGQSLQSCQPMTQVFIRIILTQSCPSDDIRLAFQRLRDAISELPPPITKTPSGKSTHRVEQGDEMSTHDSDEAGRNNHRNNEPNYDDHDDKSWNADRRDAILFDSHEDSVNQLRKSIKVISSLVMSSSNSGIYGANQDVHGVEKVSYCELPSKTD